MYSDSPVHGNEKASTAHAPGSGTGDTYLGSLRENLVAKRSTRGLYHRSQIGCKILGTSVHFVDS